MAVRSVDDCFVPVAPPIPWFSRNMAQRKWKFVFSASKMLQGDVSEICRSNQYTDNFTAISDFLGQLSLLSFSRKSFVFL